MLPRLSLFLLSCWVVLHCTAVLADGHLGVSSLGLLWIILLINICLWGDTGFHFFHADSRGSKCWAVGYYITLFKSLPYCFPKCLLHFTCPGGTYGGSSSPHLVTGSSLGLSPFWCVWSGTSLWIWIVFPYWVIELTSCIFSGQALIQTFFFF